MRPLTAGLAFLPLALAIAAGNALAGRLAGRWTSRRLLGVAFAIGAVGLAILATGSMARGYWIAVLPGLPISGLGQGLAFTGMFIAGTRELPPDAEGTGSAMITAAQYTGGAIGLALLVWVHGSEPTRSTLAIAYLTTVAIAVWRFLSRRSSWHRRGSRASSVGNRSAPPGDDDPMDRTGPLASGLRSAVF